LFCVGTRSEIFLLVFVALVEVLGVGRGRRPDFLSWSFSVLAGLRSALVSFGFSAARSRFGSCCATVSLRAVLWTPVEFHVKLGPDLAPSSCFWLASVIPVRRSKVEPFSCCEFFVPYLGLPGALLLRCHFGPTAGVFVAQLASVFSCWRSVSASGRIEALLVSC
jgi:hypothetical protein